MRPVWFFILHDGLEPGGTFGPVTSTAGEVQAIVEAMRQHSDLAAPEGTTCLYRLAVDDHGTPHVDAYSRRFMNRCRKRCRRQLDAGMAAARKRGSS